MNKELENTKEGGHQCPYCQHICWQVNDHFSHIELFHPGKPLIHCDYDADYYPF
jgi:hypothetical protein